MTMVVLVAVSLDRRWRRWCRRCCRRRWWWTGRPWWRSVVGRGGRDGRRAGGAGARRADGGAGARQPSVPGASPVLGAVVPVSVSPVGRSGQAGTRRTRVSSARGEGMVRQHDVAGRGAIRQGLGRRRARRCDGAGPVRSSGDDDDGDADPGARVRRGRGGADADAGVSPGVRRPQPVRARLGAVQPRSAWGWWSRPSACATGTDARRRSIATRRWAASAGSRRAGCGR